MSKTVKSDWWKESIDNLLKRNATNLEIDEFIVDNQLNKTDIWDYVYECHAPAACKGCNYIQFEGCMPCIRCSRRIITNDYYCAK